MPANTSTVNHSRLGFLLVAAALACVCSFVAVPASAQDEPEDKNTLSPEVEIAFREFSKKAAESRVEKTTSSVKKAAEDLAKEVKLDPAGQEKLASYYPLIIEATQAAWQDRFQEWLLPILAPSIDPQVTLEEWNAEEMARNPGEVWARPDRTEAWSDALKETLTPPQLAKHQADEAARLKKVRGELQDYFSGCENQALDVLAPVMEAELTRLQQFEKIDEPRMAKLKAAADSAIQATVNDWRKRSETRMLDMEDEARDERVKNRAFPGLNTSEKENQPKERPAWLDGLAEILTDAERASIAERQAQLRSSRSEALAMALVEALDSYIGFSSDQRARLQELFAKPLLKLPDYYFVPLGANYYYSIDPGQMFAEISDVAKAELPALLDERQWKRWQGLTRKDLARYSYYSAKENMAGLEFPPAEEMDAFEAQRLASAYLHLRTKKLVGKKRMMMEAKADSIARVAELTPDQSAILQTAAKGAAQELSIEGIREMEDWTRSYFLTIKPADLPDRLKRLNGPYFSERKPSEDPKIWAATVERVLTREQREAWKAECDAADVWKRNCQMVVIVTEIEKQANLTPEKREALRGILEPVLREYEEDFDTMFSYDFNWHLQGYYCLMPLALLTDEQLAPALDEDQIVIVRGRIPGHFGDMIANIRKNHEARLEAEAKANPNPNPKE